MVADGHAIVRCGIKDLISRHFPGYSCLEARDSISFTEVVKRYDFDLVLIDANLPNADAADLLSWLKTRNHQAKVLVLSTHPFAQYALSYYKRGAMGYVSKEAETEDIVDAISTVLKNRLYIAKGLQQLISCMLDGEKSRTSFDLLSQREFSVASALAQGKNIEQIALSMNIERSTVRVFKARIYRKLAVNNTVEFLNLANTQLYR